MSCLLGRRSKIVTGLYALKKNKHTFWFRSLWFRLFFLLLLLGAFFRISISFTLLALLCGIIDFNLLACTLLCALQATRTFLFWRSVILGVVVIVHSGIAIVVFLVSIHFSPFSFSRLLLFFLP